MSAAYRQTTLFDISQYLRRAPADQQEFEHSHRYELILFKRIIQEAFELTAHETSLKKPIYSSKLQFAVIMNNYVTGMVQEQLPAICRQDEENRLYVNKNNKFVLYFKKLDDYKMPSRSNTEHSLTLLHQCAKSGVDRLPVVFIGYTLDETNSKVSGYYASCVDGLKRVWVTDMESIEDDFGHNLAEVKPIMPKPVPGGTGRRVRAVKKPNEGQAE